MRAYDFEIPKSVADYLANGRENKLKPVVDSLLGNLSGSAPVTTRDELLAYNQGILLAVQVRADMMKMLLELFEICVASEAKLPAGNLREEFYSSQHSIDEVWGELFISSCFYGPHDVAFEDRNIEVDLYLTDGQKFELKARIYNGDKISSIPKKTVAALKNSEWKFMIDEDKDDLLNFKLCSWPEFVSDTETQIEKMRAAVRELFARATVDLKMR